MISMRKLAYGAALGALVCGMGTAAYAQETTAAIRGQVIDASGNGASNATVTITHVPTGTTVTTVSGADGVYSTRGLRVGGPYRVQATVNGATETATVASVGIGAPATVDVVFEASVSEVVITGASVAAPRNGGPTSGYGLADIQELPSLKRDLKDVARLNPFVTLDPSNLDAVLVAGVNSKFNSLTVDGVKQNDDFGLNNNGYPTQRSPISTDAVQAVAVNLAPYSVLYNDFQGANINVVTKSGTNEFHGTALYEISDDSFIGDKVRGAKVQNDFKEESYAATLGGPIIKDKLFFFGSYEKFKADRATIAGPVGSGKPIIAGNPNAAVPFITPAQVSQIQDILATQYGFSDDRDNSILGNIMLPERDEKWLAKIDWNITDNHRLAVTYQDTKGTRLIEGNRSSATQLALYSDYYIKGDALKVYTAQLNSDWTENLRTELVATRKKVVTIQQPVGGVAGNGDGNGDEETEIGQFSIGANPSTPGTGTRILAGPDVSRHANELENEVTTFRGRAFYDLGDHAFVVGAEREELKVYNLFGQRTEGEFTFNTIANLQNRLPDQLSYQNAIVDANGDGNRNEQDLAAKFDYATWNFYAQDTLHITPELSVTAGFRYTRYEQNDLPVANRFFAARYGFSNSENLDGRDVFMPRVSFDYQPEWDRWHFSRVRISGGAGLFSGGSATVWVSNSFSNTGVLGAQISCVRNATSTSCGQAAGTTDNAILAQLTDYRNIPAAVENLLNPSNAFLQNVQRAANVNAIDPHFDPIQTWKSSLSFSADLDLWQLGSGYNLTLDFLRGDVRKGVMWRDYRAGLTPIARAPDGRPIYRRQAERGLFLTGVAGTDTGSDLILTNTDEGFQQSIAIGLSKSFDFGLDASVSYTYTDAKEVSSATSSTASSNFNQVATSDSNNPGLATSNYEIKDSFKGRLTWTHQFFGDNDTSISLFVEHRSGLPFSYTYNSSTTNSLTTWGDNASNRQLFYVPRTDSAGNVTATSDPIVTYLSTGAAAVDVAALNAYLHETGLIKYAGQIAPRNAFRNPNVTRFDLRFSQEVPAFFPNQAKLTAYVDLINVGNMLNSKWGLIEQVDFPSTAPIMQTVLVNNGTQYQYSNFAKAAKPFANSDAPNRSLWQVKFGLKYSF
ncbi:MAG: TonB-dependent receptor [Phenylobacterium zucineum]|nr:MAG: TonB-dependent receptor [Phenylobacterium zucineum]